MKNTKNSKITRLILMALILGTALADIFTFLAGQDFLAFEINPIYIATRSIIFLLAIKVASNFGLCLFVWKSKLVPKTMYYIIVLSSIYMILFQGLGAYSNLKTQIDNPSPSQAMAPAQASNTYYLIALLYYVVPMILATLAYWLHSKITEA